MIINQGTAEADNHVLMDDIFDYLPFRNIIVSSVYQSFFLLISHYHFREIANNCNRVLISHFDLPKIYPYVLLAVTRYIVIVRVEKANIKQST